MTVAQILTKMPVLYKVGTDHLNCQCFAFKTNKLHQILVEQKVCSSLKHQLRFISSYSHSNSETQDEALWKIEVCTSFFFEEMGNCVQVQKSKDSASKLRCSSYSRTECILIQKPIRESADCQPRPHVTGFPEPSDEEDVHFCSDPWVESDGEDFFSVNNDLTPSRGDTPIHKSSEIEVESPNLINHKNKSKVQPVKQLIELFHESFNADESGSHQIMHYGSEAESSQSDLPRISRNVSPYRSVVNLVSSARTRKATQFAHCFLPKLVQIISFSERKRC